MCQGVCSVSQVYTSMRQCSNKKAHLRGSQMMRCGGLLLDGSSLTESCQPSFLLRFTLSLPIFCFEALQRVLMYVNPNHSLVRSPLLSLRTVPAAPGQVRFARFTFRRPRPGMMDDSVYKSNPPSCLPQLFSPLSHCLTLPHPSAPLLLSSRSPLTSFPHLPLRTRRSNIPVL